MKFNVITILICTVVLTSCVQEKEPTVLSETTIIESLKIPKIEVDKSVLFYDRMKSTWLQGDDLFSGYVVSHFSDGTLQEKFGVLDGKKQNENIIFYQDGHYRSLSNYHKGKLHGEKKNWSQDSLHVLLSHMNYYQGKEHGPQKKWYSTGELFKSMNINMGREEGIQQAYRKNGVLYANYEAKEGRIFGLKKAALCYDLDDEKVLYNK